jgi:hypothetical protein
LKRNLDGPKLRSLIQQAMEPWRSDAESEELEAEEREREREINALAGSRRREAAHASGESFKEGTSA